MEGFGIGAAILLQATGCRCWWVWGRGGGHGTIVGDGGSTAAGMVSSSQGCIVSGSLSSRPRSYRSWAARGRIFWRYHASSNTT